MEAGRAWAAGRLDGGSEQDDDALADAERWGIDLDPADLAGDPGDGIWAWLVPALRAFLAIDTQWRMAPLGMGGMRALGLDYAAARAGLDLAGIEMTPALWADVRLIEAGARAEMNGARS
ncbi:hypothetical protein FGK63_01740 [Ruegeria sediminis]|uniref:DUF1799 domain-containing protein n=1 Tax=Ruegeria sediminis TaxID=2583820 RepID=A0ABY2X368_9RHOB|nr:DUF1799 domain-containing protein [Ruegeria sediminis]TMV09817.1 hypothetical protein FGK63_01740 [Ruegeria sediminis]